MLILELWVISFDAVVVFGLGKNFFFKSILGHSGGVTVEEFFTRIFLNVFEKYHTVFFMEFSGHSCKSCIRADLYPCLFY